MLIYNHKLFQLTNALSRIWDSIRTTTRAVAAVASLLYRTFFPPYLLHRLNISNDYLCASRTDGE